MKSRFSQQFIYQPGQLHYRLEIFSTVQLTAGDSIHRVDSTRVTGKLELHLSLIPGRDQVTAQTRLDSILLVAGNGTSVPMASGSSLTFHIDESTGRVTATERTQTATCDQGDSQNSPFLGSEVLPHMQPQPVSTWVDTATTTTCRGGVPLVLRRVATYARVNASDTTYQLLRSTQLTVAGAGRQWEQRVDVAGEGTATDTLYLSGSPLRLQQITGSSYLRIQFRAPLKTQEFTQSTTTHILLQR